MEESPGPMSPPSPSPSAPSSVGGGMDLNLHIGPPHSRRQRRRRRRRFSLGTSSTSPSSSSSPQEFPATQTAGDTDVHAPYSPSRVLLADPPNEVPPISGVGDNAPVGDSLPLSPSELLPTPYERHPTPGLPEGAISGGGPPRAPYSPSDMPFSATPVDRNEVEFTSYQPISAPVESNPSGGDRISLTGLSDSEFRIRVLIDLRRRLQSIRDFRSAMSSIHDTERNVHSAPSSGEGREDPGKNGAGAAGASFIEDLEAEKKGGDSSVANFECNICLELAKEPVVTCCGHLFCWPCLFQWLHLYRSHMECPVCKGKVEESNITPIYGRGCSEAVPGDEEKETGELGLRVPPRPRGQRVESWRQQIARPATTRFREGVSESWRYLFGEQFWNRNRGLQENVEEGHRQRVFTRLRRRRSMRAGDNPENRYSVGRGNTEGASVGNPNGVATSSQDQTSINWEWFHLNSADHSGRLAALTARLSRIFGRSAASSSNNHFGYSSLSAHPQNPGDPVAAIHPNGSSQGVDPLSNSSIIAVIRDGTEGAQAVTESSTARSSSSLGRRGRSSSSGSLDVDGCLLHACKRRRLN